MTTQDVARGATAVGGLRLYVHAYASLLAMKGCAEGKPFAPCRRSGTTANAAASRASPPRVDGAPGRLSSGRRHEHYDVGSGGRIEAHL